MNRLLLRSWTILNFNMLKAILKNIIIEPPRQAPSKTAGGIFLPESHKKVYPNQGKVISIGEQVTCGVKLGDVIRFQKFEGLEVPDPETKKKVIIVNEDKVLAIITE